MWFRLTWSIIRNNLELCSCDNDGMCFVLLLLFFRDYFPSRGCSCFWDCGHPHTHHADYRLSAAQVGTVTLSLSYTWLTHTFQNTFNLCCMMAVTNAVNISFFHPALLFSPLLQTHDDSAATSSCTQN